MKKIVPQIFIVFILAISIFAQNEPDKIILVDEFNKISLEDLAARLDNLRNELESKPTKKAVIKQYGGQGDFFAFPYVRGAIIKAYLRNNRKVSAENFSVQFCNVNNEPLKTQLLLIEKNKQIDSCDENLTVPKETVLFESLYFYGNDSFLSEKPFEETSFDVVGMSDRNYSQTSQNALQNLMNKSPESKIYLVGYFSKKDKNKKSRWNVEKEMVKNGLNKSRIIKIDSGYKKDVTKVVEIWFVPKGGRIPQPSFD
jgi:hypothetical protein